METFIQQSAIMFSITSLLVFSLFLGSAYVLTPKLIYFFKKHNQVDKPDERKLHKESTPSSGGLLFALTIISSITFFYTDSTSLVISLCAFILLLVGFIDDRFDLSAKTKFLVQFICTLIVLTQINPINVFGSDYSIINYIVSFIFIVGFTNAFNLMDGLDGLAGSFALLVLAIFAILLIIQHNYTWAIYSISIIGVLLAFLYYNVNPAKIFMGDTGSLFLGFTIATIAHVILNNNATELLRNIPNEYNYLLLFGLLFLPMIDTVRVMSIRILKGNSPFKADRNHLHHYLLKTQIPSIQIPALTTAISLFFYTQTYILLSTNNSPIQICMMLIVSAIIGFTLLIIVRVQQNIKKRMEHQVYLKSLYDSKQILVRPKNLITI
ncbi:glycosyltransferase family 4 protein [Wenyingzhuangia aestuarii]|uniref:glycosyltransferase family 4 protein n=1 Tax=Wenyingzhuangia aestuarii TaxID=1647582 RepID=UPI001ADD5CAA|nr:MraY family glycosyltransferase [Wenyingzhuangia aestuarii]